MQSTPSRPIFLATASHLAPEAPSPWPSSLKRRWVQAVLLVGFWTLVGVLYTGGIYLHRLFLVSQTHPA